MNTVEFLRRIVRQQTVTIGQPVTNLVGTVPAVIRPATAVASATWHVVELPGTSLPSLTEFYSIFASTPQSTGAVVTAVDGVVAVSAAQRSRFLLSGVVTVAGPTTVPIEVQDGAGGSQWTLYVDDVATRRGVGSAGFSLSLSAGTHNLELVCVTSLLGLSLPASVAVTTEQGSLPTPTWESVTSTYGDLVSGAPVVRCTWYSDTKVGGWYLYRRELTLLATITSVGPLDPNGEFGITVTGDVTASVPVQGTVFAGNEEMGTVLTSAYDTSFGTETTLRIRLTSRRRGLNPFWTNATLGIAVVRQIAMVRRDTQTTLVSYDDASVSTDGWYQYYLQAFGLLDATTSSDLSEVQNIIAGDVQWPGSITLKGGYPKVLNEVATVKFTTPADTDYSGVYCLWRDLQASGTATSGSLTTLVDSGASFSGLTGYTVMIMSGTGSGQWRTITSHTGTTLTISTGSTPWDTAPDATSTYQVFKLLNVVTDYGVPASDDEFNFTPLGYGRHYFATFDLAGNVQPFSSAASWDYASGSGIYTGGANQPPAVTIKQLTATVQQSLAAPYNNTLQYAVVEIDAADPVDGTTGVVLEYRTRTSTTGTATNSSTSSTLVVSGTPWSTNQWKNYLVTITGGTGSGQTRLVSSNTNNTLTVASNWGTPPNNTSTFEMAWVSNLSAGAASVQVDAPAGTRSRYVAVPLGYNQNWLQVRAYDSAVLYSGTLTYAADFDLTPGVASVNPVVDTLQDLLNVTVTVDDDARSLKWWTDTNAPTTVSNLDSVKTTAFSTTLTDGQRLVLNLIPYANTDGTGSGGAQWFQEFMRPPRTSITIAERDAQGAVSNSVVQCTFSTTPSVPDVTGVTGSGTSSGSNTNTTLNDTSKQGTTGTASGTQTSTTLQVAGTPWTTNQWVGYYVTLTGGTGSGQTRAVISNTSSILTVAQWTTTPVAGSTTFSISRWGKDMFAPNTTTREVYYVRITGGTLRNSIARISGNSPTQLSLSTPWDSVNATAFPDATSTYQIQKGGTCWRTAPVVVSGSGVGSIFLPTTVPIYLTRSASGDNIEYYSELSGVTAEAVRRAFIDSDTVPSISGLAVSEINANKLAISVASFDDDCKEWLVYAKKGGYPTYDTVAVTGTATGTQTSTTLQDTTKSWTTNQWVGYYVVLTGGSADPIRGQSRRILSNNSNTLTVASWVASGTPVTATTTYSITRTDGQLDPQYLRLQSPITTPAYEFDAGTGVWYVIAVPKDSYNSVGNRVLETAYVDGSGSNVGQLYNVGVVTNDNGSTAYYNKIQWDHNSASGGMDSPATTFNVKCYAYRSDLGPSTLTEFTSPTNRRPWMDVGSNYTNSDDAEVTASKGSILHQVGTRSDAVNGVQYTWVYTVELYQSTTLVSTYTTQHTDWYARPTPQISAATASLYTSGACSLTPDYKGKYYPNPGATVKVAWSLVAGTANNQDYTIQIWKSTQASPSTYTYYGTAVTSVTEWYDYYSVCGNGTLSPATYYATYQVKLVQNGTGTVATTLTTSGSPSVTFTAGTCEAP